MLRTLPQTRDQSWVYRLAGIAFFTVLTILAARVSIPLDPVPFTLQPLAVVLSGMVLGWRDGLLSQALYVALIAAGLPLEESGGRLHQLLGGMALVHQAEELDGRLPFPLGPFAVGDVPDDRHRADDLPGRVPHR